MIRSLAWKEYREQRAVWLAMAALAVTPAVAGAWLLGRLGTDEEYYSKYQILGMFGWLVCSVYGALCAAIMLAGERESGTVPFLDGLAGWRTHLWVAKAVSGVGLIIAQAAVVALAFTWVEFQLRGRVLGWTTYLAILESITLSSLVAFAWGMLLSAVCRTSLGAVCATIAVLAVLWPGIVALSARSNAAFLEAFVLQLLSALGALGASWWLYARQDIEREAVPGNMPGPLQSLGFTIRQSGRLLLSLLALAVVPGFLLPWYAAVLWPAVTLLIGLLCGVAVFVRARGGEQQAGDRPPIAGLRWAVRLAAWAAIALAAAALMLVMAGIALPLKSWSEIRQAADHGFGLSADLKRFLRAVAERTPSEDRFAVFDAPEMLAYWLVYGFSVGMFLKLTLRRTVLARAVGIVAAPVLAGSWVPSVAMGGVHAWQLYGLPVLLVAASGLLSGRGPRPGCGPGAA